MKKKLLLFLMTFLLASVMIGTAAAQSMSKEQIASTYTKAVLREQFVNKTNPQYYRFAKRIWYFDNLALSYFPSEIISGLNWEYIDNPGYSWYFHSLAAPVQDDWALLCREGTGKVNKQMIYIDEPIEKDVIHGIDFPRVTYQSDFYLYTDLFILDNYPEGTGSAYVYFSNSPLYGNRTSYGIMIDPRDGIYKATNNYDTFQNVTNTSAFSGLFLLGTEKHELELLHKFDPSLYEGKTGSIGNDIFSIEDLDGKFNADLESIKQNAVKEGYSDDPSVYRIELVRLGGTTHIYINGVFVYEFKDNLITDGLTYYTSKSDVPPVYNGIKLEEIKGTVGFDKFTLKQIDDQTWTVYVPESVTDMVSWTIGPRLYAGGETVTMAAGNFYIYSK